MNIASTPQHGFIALTSVLVLGAIVLSVAIGAATRSITSAGVGSAMYAAYRADALANLCAERARIELIRTLDYSGDETINVDDGSCTILPIAGSGNTDRTIETTGTISGYIARLQVSVSTISPAFVVTSWKRVSQF